MHTGDLDKGFLAWLIIKEIEKSLLSHCKQHARSSFTINTLNCQVQNTMHASQDQRCKIVTVVLCTVTIIIILLGMYPSQGCIYHRGNQGSCLRPSLLDHYDNVIAS